MEILLTIGILIILMGISIPFFRSFGKTADLNRAAEETANLLRLAQSKTTASENGSQWGIKFSLLESPHQIILFAGNDFSLRDPSCDEVYQLPQSVELHNINLNDGGTEAIFEKVTGSTSQYGDISLRLKNEVSQEKRIYVSNSGLIEFFLPSVLSDENRLKDSRRVYIDYSRFIATSTERIVLNFEGDVVEQFLIADNLENGEIKLEKEINIGGEIQEIKIYTNRLNNPDTQFSILRDRRHNKKSLKIDIDNDPDFDPGSLIEYSADGLNTLSNSVYTTNLEWQ